MKGEDSFPDLDSDKAKMTFDQRSVKKNIFHQHNLDQLHNCGDCQDDFKGMRPNPDTFLICMFHVSPRSQQRAVLLRSQRVLQEGDQHKSHLQVHQSSFPCREPALD